MATIPSPRTWSNAEVVGAPYFNLDIRDGYGFMLSRPMCQVTDTDGEANVAFDSGGSPTYGAALYNWDTAEFDTDGIWDSGANTRLTCRTSGLYQVVLHVQWEQFNDSNAGNRFATIQKNNNGGTEMHTATEIGTDQTYCKASNGNQVHTNHIDIAHFFTAGDYIEAVIFNSVTTALDTSTGRTSYFSMLFLGSD